MVPLTHSIVAILLLTGGTFDLMAQQRIQYTFDAVEEAGVLVVPGNDLRFDGALQPFRDNPRSKLIGLEQVRPYGLIITNTSDRPISVVSLRWERDYANQPPNFTLERLDSRQTPDRSAQFLPGQSYMALPRMAGFGPNLALIDPAMAARTAGQFQKANTISVVVDAVIFDDGRLVGPDTGGMAVTYEAERSAIANILRDLTNIQDQGGSPRAYFQQLLTLRPQRTVQVADSLRDSPYRYDAARFRLATIFASKTEDAGTAIAALTTMQANIKPVHR
ncbi:MAG: hypothetical protein LAP40_22815 [Acidobacteriia bacterium]|nr:hypothetical protein [Terriglobia bacterium]